MEYKAPSSIDEAVALLADSNSAAHILAGGTDLLVQIRAGFIKPPLVVDVKILKNSGQFLPRTKVFVSERPSAAQSSANMTV